MSNIDINHSNPVIRIRLTYRAVCGLEWHWDTEKAQQTNWNGFNLWFVARGKGRLAVSGQHYELTPGDCFLLRMWEHHVGSYTGNEPLIIPFAVFNYFDEQGRSLTPEKITALPPRHRRMSNIPFFNDLLQRVIDGSRDGNEPGALFWLSAALKEMENEDSRLARGNEVTLVREIETLCNTIRDSPGRFASLKKLAEQFGYSKDHFIRVFRQIKGTTPMDYIIQARIDTASHLLLFSDEPVHSIAERLGYSDAFAFSKQFKDKTGNSPTLYRSNSTKQS